MCKNKDELVKIVDRHHATDVIEWLTPTSIFIGGGYCEFQRTDAKCKNTLLLNNETHICFFTR